MMLAVHLSIFVLLFSTITADENLAKIACEAMTPESPSQTEIKWSTSKHSCFVAHQLTKHWQTACSKLLLNAHEHQKIFHDISLATVHHDTQLPELPIWFYEGKDFKLAWVGAHVPKPQPAKCNKTQFVWQQTNEKINGSLWAAKQKASGCCAVIHVGQRRLHMYPCNRAVTSAICQLRAKGCYPSPEKLSLTNIALKFSKQFYYSNETEALHCKTGYAVNGTNGTETKQTIRCTEEEEWEVEHLIDCVRNKSEPRKPPQNPKSSEVPSYVVPMVVLIMLCGGTATGVAGWFGFRQYQKKKQAKTQAIQTVTGEISNETTGEKDGEAFAEQKSDRASQINSLLSSQAQATEPMQSMTIQTGPDNTEASISTSGRSLDSRS